VVDQGRHLPALIRPDLLSLFAMAARWPPQGLRLRRMILCPTFEWSRKTHERPGRIKITLSTNCPAARSEDGGS